MKKEHLIIYCLLSLLVWLFFACEDIAVTDHEHLIQGDDQLDASTSLRIHASIDNGFAGTKAYGGTSYRDATSFADKDQIAVYATRSRRDSLPGTNADIFASYIDVGYIGTASTGNWARAREGTDIYIPLFPSTHLDLYAYYPWPDITQLNEGTNTIVNANDLQNIHFRIYQDQTTTTLNYCNIMRARPIRNQSYTAANKTVSFVFDHIMSLLEFHIYKDSTTYANPENNWAEGDSLLLRRVVVMGKKISTEGYFDLTGPDPNVRITEISSTYNEAIYKRDSDPGTALHTIDAYTGATKGARRHVIIPPVDEIPANLPDPAPGEQSQMEILVELLWKPAGADHYEYTNRTGIVKGHGFASGKKYYIEVPIQRKTVDNRGELIIKESQEGWTNVSWSTSFK